MATSPEPGRQDRRTTVRWLLVALAVWAGGTLYSKLRPRTPAPTPAPTWQRPVSELTAAQQRFHAQLREFLRRAEQQRADTKTWPPAAGLFPEGWTQRQQGISVNYLGEAEGLRWLVLFIEPDPRAPREPPPPEDDEHHTLADGTPLHVTVWSQAVTEPAPPALTAFPAAEGWVERVRR